MIATHSIRRLLVAAVLLALLLVPAAIALLATGAAPLHVLLERLIVGLGIAELVLLAISSATLARQSAPPLPDLPAEAREHDDEGLESRVRRRTAELSALSSHLQQISEKERAALARELHDELGGLLIAVKMDVSWLHKRWPHPTPEIQSRWARVLKLLDDGVDFKRRVVENLHPTLLDNMGLLPAVRWIVEETCVRAGLQYTEIYPEQEPQLTEDAAIMVFRLVQESLINVVKHAHATHVRVQIDLDAAEMHVLIEDNGSGIEPERRDALSSHGLAVMRHRVRSSGGALQLDVASHGGTRVFARFPLSRILRSAAIPQTSARSAEPIPARVVRS
ncbi:MAG TPA: histidine kinase [Steroidobacteraceae bacterium]|nr:histidine kinase [Steroidobacteraceae bacterium]